MWKYRLEGRRIHEPSGRSYHLKFNPPQVEGKDDVLLMRKSYIKFKIVDRRSISTKSRWYKECDWEEIRDISF